MQNQDMSTQTQLGQTDPISTDLISVIAVVKLMLIYKLSRQNFEFPLMKCL